MHPTLFRRLWLVTCLTLLGGLVTIVPVNCVCPGEDHMGQVVHSIFPHHHGETPLTHDVADEPSVGGGGSLITEHGSVSVPFFSNTLLLRLFPWLSLMSAMFVAALTLERARRPDQQYPVLRTAPPRLALP